MCVSICTRARDRRSGSPIAESDWCDECRAAHDRYLDDQGHLADLRVRRRQLDPYAPATDAEWRDHLDDVAPLVEDPAIVPASMTCPLCCGQGAITVPTDLARSGSIRAACPWCGGCGSVPDLPDWHYPDLSERRAG